MNIRCPAKSCTEYIEMLNTTYSFFHLSRSAPPSHPVPSVLLYHTNPLHVLIFLCIPTAPAVVVVNLGPNRSGLEILFLTIYMFDSSNILFYPECLFWCNPPHLCGIRPSTTSTLTCALYTWLAYTQQCENNVHLRCRLYFSVLFWCYNPTSC